MNLLEEQTGITAIPKHLDSISFSEKGHLGLAASNLTGRNWNGVLAVFNDPEFAPNIPHVENAAMNEAGCTSVKWIDDKLVVAGTDEGTVEVWKVVDPPKLESVVVLSEHNDICSSVSVSKQTKQILSASWDGCIKIWDLEVDLAIHNILYHTDKVLNVEWNIDSGDSFASVSEDGTVKMFDNRTEDKPGVLLSYTTTKFPTSLTWKNNAQLTVGYDNGDICEIDTRMAKEVSCFQAHKLQVSSVMHVENKIVSTSDDMSVKAHSLSDNFKCTYEDKRHTDYVRGLAFRSTDKTFWTCAWDGAVYKHNI